MMSLGVSKGGVMPATDEDRRRIIKQMKVRTTLRGDKSWIHHHNSDSEEDKSSPLSGRAAGGASASKPPAPQSDRSPAPKPQSGYLIRGVFTRTIDKTSSVPDSSSSNGAQKSSGAKGAGAARAASAYRLTTEDYKKLAPYNVKQKSVEVDEEDVPFTPDEHKKRTEAANSVLRRTASKERAYVLSAAKKSNGSPTQDFPPLFAKRIEIEEEEGQQKRSAAGPGWSRVPAAESSINGLRKTPAGSAWNEPKATAVSAASSDTGSKSQASTSFSETSERISTSAAIRKGENHQAANGRSSSGVVSQSGAGYPEHTEANNGFYSPEDRPAGVREKLHHHYGTSQGLDDAQAEAASSGSRAAPHSAADRGQMSGAGSDILPPPPPPPPERAPVHLEDTEYSFKGSLLGSEERSSSQESSYTSAELPAHSKPYWNEVKSSPDSQDGNTPREKEKQSTRTYDGYKPELTPEGFLGSSNHTEKGQEPPDHNVHPEPPSSKEHTELEPSMTRSSSLLGESSITAPETQPVNGADPSWQRITAAYEEQTQPTPEGHQESPGDWRQPNPEAARSNFSSRESALSAYEPQHPMALHMDHQPFHTSFSAASHRIPSYVDSQVFSSRRATPDYEGRVSDGRSSPRSSRYESPSARGHYDLNPPAGRHNSLPRDPTMSISQRSHRVPFYMDSLNYNSTRLLSGSSEGICSPMATLPHSSPAASAYQPDPSSVGKGVLFVKEYVNSSGLPTSSRYGSGSPVDLTDLERGSYSHHSYLSSSPLQRSSEPVCSYCSREIRDCPKIIIEHLNIYCHEYCFRCGICHKAMGDLLDKIFIHRDIVHCDKCYEKLF